MLLFLSFSPSISRCHCHIQYTDTYTASRKWGLCVDAMRDFYLEGIYSCFLQQCNIFQLVFN